MSDPNQPGLLVIISAPSGGGKTTLCEQVLASNPATARAVTCTTRAPREGEKHGVDYYFLRPEEFLKAESENQFLEHATVHGNHYGTLKSEVLGKLAQGKDVLLSIDVQGAATLRRRSEEDPELRRSLVSIFLAPTDLSVLEERLKRRGKDSADTIRRRLAAAQAEIAEWRHFDYLIITTSIAEDLRRLEAILVAEKLRQIRARLPDYL